jgi:hypothetical protein
MYNPNNNKKSQKYYENQKINNLMNDNLETSSMKSINHIGSIKSPKYQASERSDNIKDQIFKEKSFKVFSDMNE